MTSWCLPNELLTQSKKLETLECINWIPSMCLRRGMLVVGEGGLAL